MGLGECCSLTYRKWLKAFPYIRFSVDTGEWYRGRPWRRNLCWLYAVILPGCNIFFAFQMPVRVTEPNPDWIYYGATRIQRQLAMGARDYSSGTHNHKWGPNPESTVSPPLIFHFNHWLWAFLGHTFIRVPTVPEKFWKVIKFDFSFFRTWKVLKLDMGAEKGMKKS